MSWRLSVLSMEVRKLLSYRLDFWVKFLGTIAVEYGVAYFLWDSIYKQNQLSQVEGYTFQEMMVYYLFAPLVSRVSKGAEYGVMTEDIYGGGLSRYLVYPVSFIETKWISHLAHSLMAWMQLFVVLALMVIFFPGFTLSLGQFISVVLLLSLGMVAYFLIAGCLELVAFWQDNVWSLMVLLKFLVAFAGGGMFPLVLFPAPVQEVLRLLPFPYFVSVPIQMISGKTSVDELSFSMGVLLVWTVGAALVMRVLWARGLRQYTGVGA